MEKVQVMSVGPAACVGRGSVGPPQTLRGGPLPPQDQSAEYMRPRDRKSSKGSTALTSQTTNVINNNVEVNGLVNGGITNSNNNNNNNSNVSDRGNARKKSTDAKNREQGTMGFVSERVRALSVSNRPKTSSSHRFGPPDLRASYNERLRSGPTSLQPPGRGGGSGRPGQEVGGGFVYMRGTGGLYRSNSSLELDHDAEEQPPASPLRREYGSHGSINVAAAPPETLFNILRDLQPSGRIEPPSTSADNVAGAGEAEATSPKVRSKFQKLWDKDKSSIFKKLRSSKSTEGKADSKSDVNSESSVPSSSSKSSKTGEANGETDSRGEESVATVPARRSAFAHYDCRSLAAHLTSVHIRSSLTERANTTTGASAAAMAGTGSGGSQHDSTEDLRPDESDPGDGRSNHLVNSCPFFRNELGGESERVVSLSRDWGCGTRSGSSADPPVLYRSVAATTIGLLEPATGQSHWRTTLCPYVRSPYTIEAVDQGAGYYRSYFCGQEHQNWLGVDDSLGPVAVSIRREKVEDATDSAHSLPTYQYRIIVRTSELFSCQGTVLEESLGRPGGEKGRGPGVREVLEYVCPQLSVGCLRLGHATSQTEEALLRLDELGVHKKFKIGVLYCRAGQTTEEEMYNNETAGPAFSEFLETLGQRVRLKDFDKYRGGLDKKTDSTGLYSVYTQYRDLEVMFHVSTLLPFTPNNRKQLLRKRHIGNDIVTIIFQEPGAPPFSPKHIRSHFQHVFIVVQAVNPCSENTQYSVTVSRFRDVPMFGPMMTEGATFPKSKTFAEFLIAKAINGEIAALRSEKFAAMATRTRHEYLKDLALNHTSSTTLDTSTKFSLMGFSRGGKKDKRAIKYISDASLRGALSWPLSVKDNALQQNVDCVLGISVDSLVVLEESSASVIFAAPCKTVIGWTIKPLQGLRIFYHQGECLQIYLRQGTPETDAEEIIAEIVARLSAVTGGAETQELVLRRNSAGLLGFNVQQDGVITEVETYGLASQSGLRQGARIVEICTVALSTLSQEQMVDLLKTSMTVTVCIVPPHLDGTPRRGCNVPTCGFLLGGSEGDYENLNTPEELSRKHLKSRHNHTSSNSSGYGTGSSSRSFTVDQRSGHDYHDQARLQQSDYHGERQDYQNNSNNNSNTSNNNSSSSNNNNNNNNLNSDYDRTGDYDRTPDYMGTLSSTSSGHSSDRWTEPYEEPQDSPPPPLPARSTQGAKRRGDLFHSSFHNRGMPASAPHSSSPSSSSSHPNYASPPSHPSYPPSGAPSTGYAPSHGQSSLTPTPMLTSSPSPTSHSHNSVGIYVTPYHSSHLKPELGMGDSANYAVPPPHPRPLHVSHEEAAHFPGSGDYDNAPLKPVESQRVRQSTDTSASVTLQSSTVSQGQVNEYIAWRNERLNSNVRSSSLPGYPARIPGQDENNSSTERLHPTRSEDELSGSSGSPHTRRRIKGGNTTPSSTSSRNQSPRTVTTEARLRQAATPRKSSQRNSANLGSSSLQEELFRLINPDYISDTESLASREGAERPRAFSVSLGTASTTGHNAQGSRSNNSSLDRVSVKSGGGSVNGERASPGQALSGNPGNSTIHTQGPSPPQPPGVNYRGFPMSQSMPQHLSSAASTPTHGQVSPDPNHNVPSRTEVAEVVVLTARPATVISNSSATSSPATTSDQRGDLKIGAGPPDPRGPPHPHVPDQRTVPARDRYVASSSADPSLKNPQWVDMSREGKGAPSEAVSGEQGGGLDVDQEWMSLVNTATQAIQKSGDMIGTSQARPPHPSQPQNWQLQSSVRSLDDASTPMDSGHLQDRLVQLERQLAAEQQRSEQLEDEVSQLRTENRKLQEDSRAAAQQLHQFTEWFFNTIDKT
ncbi:signal-induced proliferation-associated 1-like protein 1 isoform X2 [Penaeus monodon]|uniref:signal-induced proliferation-associated 1-like protein 1 isoform X2 n=1 Tax=Penaeus monodon TaxID=6687 RepID=UPI0018A6D618|nr:signal-induced proliferation-associated 1-like protein 1 isoform X2 [Penaeus monodon]